MAEAFDIPVRLYPLAEAVVPLPFQVLARMPEVRNIPIFALGLEKGRAAVEIEVAPDQSAMEEVMSGDTVRALSSGRYGANQIVSERRRWARRTAIHSIWLAFSEAKCREAFLLDYPHLGLDAFARQTEVLLRACESKFQKRLISGSLDKNASANMARDKLASVEEVKVMRLHLQAIGLLSRVHA